MASERGSCSLLHSLNYRLKYFTGSLGKYVTLKDTLSSFKAILNGEYDHLPEQAFYMVGGIDEVVEKATKL